uniref:Uncharacterized protein n=1 Tax=Panagrolaimus superbus TaxID=310955 RepID=A0A914XZQ9_9BILA
MEVSSSSSSSEAEQEKAKQVVRKKQKKDETTTIQTIEKKDSNKESSKKKKKNSSQELTDNTPTVFESVDCPLNPVVEERPVHKIEMPTGKGTGKAAVRVDNTPTAYGTVQPKKKSKKKEGDSDDDSDYLPIHPAYK